MASENFDAELLLNVVQQVILENRASFIAVLLL